MLNKRKLPFFVLIGLLLVMSLSACLPEPPVEVDPLIDPPPGPLPTSAVTPTEHLVETLAPTPAASPGPAASPEPGASPTPMLGNTGGSLCQVEGQNTFNRVEGNFCFAFPSDFEILGSGNPLQAYLMGPALDQSMEPVRASMFLEVTPVDAANYTLEIAAQEFLARHAGIPTQIEQTEITFGGFPALQFEPVPGRVSSRDVVVIYKDLLYHFSFSPLPEEFPQAEADVERIFDSIDSSFSILQP